MEFESEKDFWYHQGDIHSIFGKATTLTKRKADVEESHFTSEGPRKSTRMEIKQWTESKSLSLIAAANTPNPEGPCVSDRLENQGKYSAGEMPDPSPRAAFAALDWAGTADIYASFGSSCGPSLYTDAHSGVARPNPNSTVSLEQVDEGFSVSGVDETSLPVDPQLISGVDITTPWEPVSSTSTDTGSTEVTIVEQSTDDTQPHDPHDLSDQEAYLVDSLLGRWGKSLFYLRWLDGSYSWEPRENILDDELVRRFEESYQGFKDSVEVLRTRSRNGKVEYRLHWEGRPKNEDWWVAEKELHPELIEEHKPRKKGHGKKGHGKKG
jgi:hypothetical protein